jgi:hypothetical protein
MTRNKNNLILEFCRDGNGDGDGNGEGNGNEEVQLFSIVPREQEYSTEEIYVIQEQIEPDVLDPIRSMTGYHWSYAGEENEIETQRLFLDKPSIRFVKVDEYTIDDSEVFSIKQMIELDKKAVEKALKRFNIKIVEDKFEEKLTEIANALSNSSNNFNYIVIGQNRPSKKLFDSEIRQSFEIQTKNRYNSYDETYESKSRYYPTTGLPNYYLLSEDNYYRSSQGGEEYKNTDIANYGDTVATSLSTYIKQFSEKQIPEEITNFVSTKMNNILFPHDKMSSYEEMREAKTEEIFPYSLQLEFDTEPVGRISRSLKQDQLNDYLLSYIRRREDREEMQNILFTIKGNESALNKRVEIDTLLLSDQFFRNLVGQSEFDDLEDSDICYLDKIEVDNVEPLNFHEQQELLKYEQIMSYDMMLEGKSCYSETLYYKVDKYEIDQENYQKVQSFYLSNVDDVSKVKILDTQVKYGKKYRYEVFSYKYVLGYKYSYEKNQTLNSFYTVDIIPTPYIIKMAFAVIEEAVLDKPPAPPEVEVIPYKDNSKEISFFFNPSSVEYKMQEYAFSEEERLQYALVRESQNLDYDEFITFGGDDKTEKYYIYRIEYQPSSYEDFKDNLYRIAQTEENCSSAEYLDTLESNKKYYYIFRAVDVHGHISAPTDVRQIELINEDGNVFLQSKIVPFRELSFRKEDKSAKKYIHIRPTLIQSLIDENTLEPAQMENEELEYSALDVLDNIVLGNNESIEESVWGKRFKMRIKSKSTNKFVDVKFMFKTKKERNNL